MARANRKQLDEAKKLLAAGEKSSQVSKKTGVSPATCQIISKSLYEPPILSRPMNEEEIKKYGSPSNADATSLKNQKLRNLIEND